MKQSHPVDIIAKGVKQLLIRIVELRSILDFSLGNYLCLRGYTPMGLLSASRNQRR